MQYYFASSVLVSRLPLTMDLARKPTASSIDGMIR